MTLEEIIKQHTNIESTILNLVGVLNRKYSIENFNELRQLPPEEFKAYMNSNLSSLLEAIKRIKAYAGNIDSASNVWPYLRRYQSELSRYSHNTPQTEAESANIKFQQEYIQELLQDKSYTIHYS